MRAAFFDLDKTVIAKASIAAFGRPFYRGGLINRRLIARAIVSQIIYLHLGASEQKLARVRESMLALTKGWDREQIREIVREALEETVEPIIYAEALDLIEAHRAAGYKVYLVSASPEEIVEPLAEHLGVDGCIATRAVVDDEGRYAGEMEFYAYGPFKAEAMRTLAEAEGLDLAESSAYSDSYTDLPMLEAVGHPVAVNPDRVLAKVAREREWEVMQFTKPVRLRDRVSVPSLPVTATAAGVTAVATAGALLGVAAGPATSYLSGTERSGNVRGRHRFRGARGRVTRPAASSGPDLPDGGGYCAQAERSRWAATAPRAMMTIRITSFFMGEEHTHSGGGVILARASAATPRRSPRPGGPGRSGPVERSPTGCSPRRSAGRARRCPRTDGAASTWPGPRSGGSAHGSG